MPVANVFGILAEEELLSEKLPGKDTTDGEECVIGKTNEVDEADKIENGDIEEIMNRAKTKFRTNLRANIRAKIMTKPASEDLTEEEITVLENELVEELEDSIDIELESLRLWIESETMEAFDHLEVEDYEDTNEANLFIYQFTN